MSVKGFHFVNNLSQNVTLLTFQSSFNETSTVVHDDLSTIFETIGDNLAPARFIYELKH